MAATREAGEDTAETREDMVEEVSYSSRPSSTYILSGPWLTLRDKGGYGGGEQQQGGGRWQ